MTDFKDLNHELVIKAKPSEVYNAILSSEKHSAFTEAPAIFDAKENGEFSTFNGAITGKVSKLKKDKLILLKWRAGAFPEGYFTDVEFKLEKVDEGTKIKFTHSQLPAEAFDMINEGWKMNYWSKLPVYLES